MMSLRNLVAKQIERMPIVGPSVLRYLRNRRFPGSQAYWETHYAAGGNSGSGSYGRLAEFKAEVLNRFVQEHGIRSAIEFGCGDGNQLSLLRYPSYIGLDVSPAALRRCRQLFPTDPNKSFFLFDTESFVDRAGLFRAELALSLDVLFHIVEDHIYDSYMRNLFDAATRFVCIYSSNQEKPAFAHERHHQFTSWVEKHRPQWKLLLHVPNRFPLDPANPEGTSHSDFFFFSLS